MSYLTRGIKGLSAAGDLSDSFRPQMTSLIDILTLLLVFLIQSFSAEGTLITPSSDLTLPISQSRLQPTVAPSLEITSNAVVAEGRVLATQSDIATQKTQEIPGVLEYCAQMRAAQTDTGRSLKIIIQCDRSVEFLIVKKVLFSCSKAGFTDYSVLVIED